MAEDSGLQLGFFLVLLSLNFTLDSSSALWYSGQQTRLTLMGFASSNLIKGR